MSDYRLRLLSADLSNNHGACDEYKRAIGSIQSKPALLKATDNIDKQVSIRLELMGK